MPHLAGYKCRVAPAVNSQQAKVCRVWYGLRGEYQHVLLLHSISLPNSRSESDGKALLSMLVLRYPYRMRYTGRN